MHKDNDKDNDDDDDNDNDDDKKSKKKQKKNKAKEKFFYEIVQKQYKHCVIIFNISLFSCPGLMKRMQRSPTVRIGPLWY